MTYVDPLLNITRGQQFVDNIFTQRANRQAGQRVRNRDFTGASNALLENGDIQGGLALQGVAQDQSQQDMQRQLAFTLQATRALRNAQQQGQDVLQAYDSYAPALRQMGTTDEQIQQFRGQLAQNPDQFLNGVEQFVGQEQRRLQIENLGEGYAVAIDPSTGQEVQRYERPRTPQRVVVGNDYVEVTPEGTVRPLYQGARDPEYIKLENSDGTERLVAVGGRDAGVIEGAGSAATVDPVEAIQAALPDVRFTSGLRTTEQNRSAGGAPNSFHLRGQAVDIAPPQGVSIDQFRRQLESQGVRVRELLNEGDHWHIAWDGDGRAPNIGRGEAVRPAQGGVRVVASGQNNGPGRAELAAENREQRADLQAQSALRREFNGRQEVRDFRTVQAAYDSVRSAASNPSAAGDLSLIFAYMKILDPGSVVREQEFANAQNAAGVPDQIRNAYNRVLSGERLNPNQRQDFVGQANNLYQTRRATFTRLENEYRTEAELSGFNPDRIVPQSRSDSPMGRRLRFDARPEQLARAQAIVRQRGDRPEPPRGDRLNPVIINPADATSSYANVPRGGYFITPDGQLRGPKP